MVSGAGAPSLLTDTHMRTEVAASSSRPRIPPHRVSAAAAAGKVAVIKGEFQSLLFLDVSCVCRVGLCCWTPALRVSAAHRVRTRCSIMSQERAAPVCSFKYQFKIIKAQTQTFQNDGACERKRTRYKNEGWLRRHRSVHD